jgi:hypothetical protein
MIELDLKKRRLAWPALAAVACHFQWRSVRRGSGFTSRVSRIGVKAARVKAVEPSCVDPFLSTHAVERATS